MVVLTFFLGVLGYRCLKINHSLMGFFTAMSLLLTGSFVAGFADYFGRF